MLGKLATQGLLAVYAFLAAFPIIGTCFLLGGVTGTDFLRVIFLLLNTAFLSLSVGALVTPIRPREVIAGHWRALCRTFLPPMMVLLLILGAVGHATLLQREQVNRASWSSPGSSVPPAEIERILADLNMQMRVQLGFEGLHQLSTFVVPAWFGMWMGMITPRIHVAVAKTLILADLLTALVSVLASMAIQTSTLRALSLGSGSFWLSRGFEGCLSLILDGILVFIAWRRVRRWTGYA